MKKAILLMALLLISSVSAIDKVGIGITGIEDIEVIVTPNTPGTTTYIMNGKNVDTELERIESKISPTSDADYRLQSIYNVFMEYDYEKHYYVETPKKSLSKFELIFRKVFVDFFVPRTELREAFIEQQKQIDTLTINQMAYEKLFTEEEICDAKMEVVKELNLNSVTCGEVTYYNHQVGFTGLRRVK